MTLPIPSNVFADGELTNEVKWYQRIFTAINTIYTSVTALQASTDEGNFSGTTSVGGQLTVSHGLGATPTVVLITMTAPDLGLLGRVISRTSSNFTVKIYNGYNASGGLNSVAVSFDWFVKA